MRSLTMLPYDKNNTLRRIYLTFSLLVQVYSQSTTTLFTYPFNNCALLITHTDFLAWVNKSTSFFVSFMFQCRVNPFIHHLWYTKVDAYHKRERSNKVYKVNHCVVNKCWERSDVHHTKHSVVKCVKSVTQKQVIMPGIPSPPLLHLAGAGRQQGW